MKPEFLAHESSCRERPVFYRSSRNPRPPLRRASHGASADRRNDEFFSLQMMG
jgi:hypothetical protein